MKTKNKYIAVATLTLTANIEGVENTKQAIKRTKEWKNQILTKYGRKFAGKPILHPIS